LTDKGLLLIDQYTDVSDWPIHRYLGNRLISPISNLQYACQSFTTFDSTRVISQNCLNVSFVMFALYFTVCSKCLVCGLCFCW